MSIGISGIGKKVTVSAGSPTRLVLNADNPSYYANNISVYNNGTEDIFALVNCTTSEFTANIANAIPIAAKTSFSFCGNGRPPVFSICMQSTSIDCSVYLGAF